MDFWSGLLLAALQAFWQAGPFTNLPGGCPTQAGAGGTVRLWLYQVASEKYMPWVGCLKEKAGLQFKNLPSSLPERKILI